MTNDDHDERLRVLERQVADLRGQLSRTTGPMKRIFIAKRNDDDSTLWHEQTVNAGVVEEFTDGRRRSDPEDDFAIVDRVESQPLMEVDDFDEDGNAVKRYVDIGDRSAIVKVGAKRPEVSGDLIGMYDGYLGYFPFVGLLQFPDEPNCLIRHMVEGNDGYQASTQLLEGNNDPTSTWDAYTTGFIRNTLIDVPQFEDVGTPDRPVVYVSSGQGNVTADHVEVGDNTEGMHLASTWVNQSGSVSSGGRGAPTKVWLVSRVYYDTTDKVLYGFKRAMYFDAQGCLYQVSGEDRFEIDAATACDPAP